MKLFFTICLSTILIVHVHSRLDKNLGDSCASTADCKWAYSYCSSDEQKCVCRKGFNATGGENSRCKPSKRFCPPIVIDGVEKEQSAGAECSVKHSRYNYDQFLNHTCGADEYCFPHVNSVTTDKDTFAGHCCPKPPPTANVGLACPESQIYNGTCLDMSLYGGGVPVPPELGPFCPLGSHRCLTHPFCPMHDDDCLHRLLRTEQICCPDPCIGRNVDQNILGQCHENSYFNRECVFDSQCPHKSLCRPNSAGKKSCQCPEGTTYEDSATACWPY